MAQYRDDPRWLTARFGTCEKCGVSITGKQAFYYPKGKHIYCEACGEPMSREFEAMAQDEAAYASQY